MFIMDHHDRVVAYNLQRLRKEFNLTQKDVAEIINVTPATVGKMEKGLSEIKIEHADALSSYFNVPVDLFLSTNHEYEQEYRAIDKLYKSRKFKEALDRCKCLLKNTEHIPVFHSLVMNFLGKIYFLMGKHKKAYFNWYQVRERTQNLNDNILNYRVSYNLSLVCYYLRDYKMSLYYIEEVLNHFNVPFDYGVYIQRAILLIHEKRFDEALGLLFENLGSMIRDNKLSEATRTIHNIAFAYAEQGLFEDAKFYYEQALNEGYAIKEPDSIGVTAADLSEIYIREDNDELARKTITDALSLDNVPLHYEIRLKCILALITKENWKRKQILMSVVDRVEECMDHELVGKYYKQLVEVFKAQCDIVNAFKYSELCANRYEEKINNSLKDI